MKNLRFLFVLIPALMTIGCESSMDDGNFAGLYYDAGGENRENYKGEPENPFVQVSQEPLSTFSVDADGGSYSNTRRFINAGRRPPKEAVRIEEYLNYFTFNYPDPSGGEHVALNADLAECPWNGDHYLMRLGMKGISISEGQMPNANYVFLIDVSGSMNSRDKLEILKSGFKLMTDQLRDQDRVAIVTYAGAAEVLLQSTTGDDKKKIKRAIDKLGAGGSTAGAEGIITAYEIAEDHFIEGGNNRVILGSDGDFNVGPSSTDELIELIEEKRESGIYLTVLGVGTGNLNDHMMEQIANKGNGNYEYIDNARQLEKVFVHERAKFYTVAKDSKIQVRFDSSTVFSYRLIGYENRALESEEFEDDSTDAGEIGAGQTITAMYELILLEDRTSDHIATFDFRYKKPEQDQSRPLALEVDLAPVSMETASENMRFAAAVTAFGLLNRQSQYKGDADRQMVLELAGNAVSFDPHGYREEFIDLVEEW